MRSGESLYISPKVLSLIVRVPQQLIAQLLIISVVNTSTVNVTLSYHTR